MYKQVFLSSNPMAEFFKFEADFVESLRCIPMQVRYNLDTCGVKLKLAHWNGFSEAQKQALVEQSCESAEEAAAYREFLQGLIVAQAGAPAKLLPVEEHPAWLDANPVPREVAMKAEAVGLTISSENWSARWAKLSPLQRFALIKLSRPSHENLNFIPAMQEFGIVT